MIPIVEEKNRETDKIQALCKSFRDFREHFDVEKQKYSTVKGKC